MKRQKLKYTPRTQIVASEIHKTIDKTDTIETIHKFQKIEKSKDQCQVYIKKEPTPINALVVLKTIERSIRTRNDDYGELWYLVTHSVKLPLDPMTFNSETSKSIKSITLEIQYTELESLFTVYQNTLTFKVENTRIRHGVCYI